MAQTIEREKGRTKAAMLARFMEITQGVKIELPHILRNWKIIKNEHTGSTFAECSIRVTGNRAFIEDVLSRFPDFADAENGITRLTMSESLIDPTKYQSDPRNPSYSV